ncbi:MAG TPA: hypothetical protein VLK65_07075 [Vicinamibacteria bacterium]|nr:hypothetical protein [Vicinamibacteria bacterium]
MVRVELGRESPEWDKLLPEAKDDGSGIGINYADAYIKIFKTTLEDGRKVLCKRRGLKLTLTVGERTGEGLMRRLEHGPDVKNILCEALKEAARNAGAEFETDDGALSLVVD